MSFLKNEIERIDAGLPAVTNKVQYIAHCKKAIADLRAWALHSWLCIRYVVAYPKIARNGQVVLDVNGKPIITYGLNSKSGRQYGEYRGLGLSFFDPQGQLYAGGSFCSPLDNWNRHVGLWRAIKHAVPVPADVLQLVGQHTTYDARVVLDPNYGRKALSFLAAEYSSVEAYKLGHDFEWFNCRDRLCEHELPQRKKAMYCDICGKALWKDYFPARTRPAVCDSVLTALWCKQNKENPQAATCQNT